MKKLILATALTAFSTISFAQSLPETEIVTMQVECGDSQEIKQFLRSANAEPVLKGKTLNPQTPGGTSILMVNPQGVYTLLIESPGGEFVCMVDYGKFSKPGTPM